MSNDIPVRSTQHSQGGGWAAMIVPADLARVLSGLLQIADPTVLVGTMTNQHGYICTGLDRAPTQINRDFGPVWGIGEWLMPAFMAKICPQATPKLREKVAAEITAIFASVYTNEVSFSEVLEPDAIAAFGRKATGEKHLIRSQK